MAAPPSILPGAGFRLPTLYNPFAIRVLQIFTGFGVGCGVGIGVGSPINLRAVPGMNSIPLGSFGGVGHQVQFWVKKAGIKNLQAGIGCGVGLGHGFGLGITLKPGAVAQLKSLTEQGLLILHDRVKSVTGNLETRLENEKTSSHGTLADVETSLPNVAITKEAAPLQTDKLLGGLLNASSPIHSRHQSGQDSMSSEVARLQMENRVLLTLLTHQEQIEQLRKDNELLKEMLAQTTASVKETERNSRNGSKCFECRRRNLRKF